MTIKEYNNNKDYCNKFALYICQKLGYSIKNGMYHGQIEWLGYYKEDIIVYIGGAYDTLHIKSLTRGLFLNSVAMDLLLAELKKIGYVRS
jgi:hypothetical protein